MPLKPKVQGPSRLAKARPEKPTAKRQQPLLPKYFKMVKRFPLIPIQNDDHLNQALERVEELLKGDQDQETESYMSVLVGLIETYERESTPISDVSESDVLRELMRQNGLTQSALAEKSGIAQPTISAVLKGSRSLTKVQVVALSRLFRVSPDVFLQSS